MRTDRKVASLPDFMAQHATTEACLARIIERRWPSGFVCPRCHHVPDARKRRPIRDRMDHLLSTFGLSGPYRSPTDQQSWGSMLSGSVAVTIDPRQQAAMQIRDDVEAWANRNGVTINAGGGDPKDRSTALYRARAAFARGETDRAERWMEQYYDLGGKPQNLASSKRNMHPLAALTAGPRAAYIKTLSQKDKARLQGAISQWKKFWGKPDTGFNAVAIRAWKKRAVVKK